MAYKRISPISVAEGGSGLSTITNHSVLVGAAAAAVTPLTVGTNGQVLVGSTAADPAFSTLTSTNGTITFTTGAHTLDLAVGPNPSAFLAYASTNQTITANTSATIVFGGTPAYNVGNHFASNTFTAPTTGKLYAFYCQVAATNASTSDEINFLINGVQYSSTRNGVSAGGTASVQMSITLPLTAGDTVTMQYHNAAPAATSATIIGLAAPPTLPYVTWFQGLQLN